MHPVIKYSITFAAGFGSLLAGANVVHQIYKPDVTIRVEATSASTSASAATGSDSKAVGSE